MLASLFCCTEFYNYELNSYGAVFKDCKINIMSYSLGFLYSMYI